MDERFTSKKVTPYAYVVVKKDGALGQKLGTKGLCLYDSLTKSYTNFSFNPPPKDEPKGSKPSIDMEKWKAQGGIDPSTFR